MFVLFVLKLAMPCDYRACLALFFSFFSFNASTLLLLLHSSHFQAMQQISVGFTQQQLQVVDDLEAVAEERNAEITRIAQSIEELAQIFKELAVLVIDQGTILDRIDYNMEQVTKQPGAR